VALIIDKITNKTLIRIGGIGLYLLLAPMALTAAILLPLLILIAPQRSIPSIRCFDEMANAFWFGGSAYESLSSHAWRARDTWWGRLIIWVTDLADKGHCERQNEYERRIVEFVANE
jgi:hypothetical protein